MSREREILEPNRIIDEAFAIIQEEGFHGFSSRKLASRLSVSHMTVYNYYSRDEIMVKVIRKGFLLFNEGMDPGMDDYIQSGREPIELFKHIAESMISFAKRYTNIYRFMFTEESNQFQKQASIQEQYYSAEKRMEPFFSDSVFEQLCEDSNLFLLLVNVIILAYLSGRHDFSEAVCRKKIERSFRLLLSQYCFDNG